MSRRHDNRTQKAELIARGRELFIAIAERNGLEIEWDQNDQVDLSAFLRQQPGLDWTLYLSLQNDDEVGVHHAFFGIEWFPADAPKSLAAFEAAVDGLVSGEVRLICRFRRSGSRPYAVDLERQINGVWKAFYFYRNGLHFGRSAGRMVLRNGHPPEASGRAAELPVPSHLGWEGAALS